MHCRGTWCAEPAYLDKAISGDRRLARTIGGVTIEQRCAFPSHSLLCTAVTVTGLFKLLHCNRAYRGGPSALLMMLCIVGSCSHVAAQLEVTGIHLPRDASPRRPSACGCRTAPDHRLTCPSCLSLISHNENARLRQRQRHLTIDAADEAVTWCGGPGTPTWRRPR